MRCVAAVEEPMCAAVEEPMSAVEKTEDSDKESESSDEESEASDEESAAPVKPVANSADYVSDLENLAEHCMYPAIASSIINYVSTGLSIVAAVKYIRAGNNLKKLGPNGDAKLVAAEKARIASANNFHATAGTMSLAGSISTSAAVWAAIEQLANKTK
jgi:hypothetical protein